MAPCHRVSTIHTAVDVSTNAPTTLNIHGRATDVRFSCRKFRTTCSPFLQPACRIKSEPPEHGWNDAHEWRPQWKQPQWPEMMHWCGLHAFLLESLIRCRGLSAIVQAGTHPTSYYGPAWLRFSFAFASLSLNIVANRPKEFATGMDTDSLNPIQWERNMQSRTLPAMATL